jgi:hypothetical protein
LIDTGSDLCVYARRLIPQHRELVHYDLCAANGTTIHSYGWLPLSLNFGLSRDFRWRFVVADVTRQTSDTFLDKANVVADAFTRVESVTVPPSYDALAE